VPGSRTTVARSAPSRSPGRAAPAAGCADARRRKMQEIEGELKAAEDVVRAPRLVRTASMAIACVYHCLRCIATCTQCVR
jgi:hypothetical protein